MVSMAKSTPPKPEGCTNFKLHKLARLVGRRYDMHMAQVGLTTAQYALLNHVKQLGPLRPVDLARAMGLTASTLTRNLQPLVDAGWLALRPGVDARSRLVQLTETGEAKRLDAKQCWRQAQLALNARLGTAQVAALHALLDQCAQLLTDDDAPVETMR